MICRLKGSIFQGLIAGACLLLSACGGEEAEVTPLDRAHDALRQGDGTSAEILLREMMESGTPESELVVYLAEAEIAQGNLIEARKWLTTEKLSKETHGEGFHMLGRLEMMEGNLSAAGQAFDKALQSDGESAELWVDIGRLRYRGGEQALAIDASIKAVEIDPNNSEALRFRGQLLRDSQGLQVGIEWFEKALAENPDHPALLADYAATLGDYGREKDMLATIRHLHEVDPGNAQIIYWQAVLAARAGDFDLAGLLLLRSGQLDRNVPAAMMLSGVIDIEKGNYASAAQILDRLSARQPDNMRAKELLARSLALGGNFKELAHRFGDDARLPSGSPYLQTLVGRAYEALGDRQYAAQFLDLAARNKRSTLAVIRDIEPDKAPPMGKEDDSRVIREQVRAAIAGGRTAQAVARANFLVKRFPGANDALVLSGDAYLAVKRPDRALERYDRAAAIRRSWPLLRKMNAALKEQKRGEDSLILQDGYFKGDPGNAHAAGELAREAFHREDWPLAAAYGDHALANGGGRDPLLLVLMTDIFRNLGETENAVELAEAAYGLQPLNREATLGLIRAYADAGGNEEMILVLEAKAKKLAN